MCKLEVIYYLYKGIYYDTRIIDLFVFFNKNEVIYVFKKFKSRRLACTILTYVTKTSKIINVLDIVKEY